MGGNKHKNGIVCTFPGCAKTMRTQKFKLHFTKQHLKPGEAYSVEHRRRFEVAREDEYAVDSATTTTTTTTAPTAAATGASHHGEHQHAAMSVQIPAAYHVTAPSVMTALSGLTPTFTPPTANSAAAGGASTSSSTDSSPEGESTDEKRGASHHDEIAQIEMLQRLNRMSAQLAPAQQRAQDARAAFTVATGCSSSDGGAGAGAGAPLAASVGSLPATTKRPAAVALELSDALDPSRAVLVKYIELMDQRFHELVQKMGQVIDGQRELIDALRRPFPVDATQLLAQTPSLAQQLQQSQALSADASSRKRRKANGAGEQLGPQQQQQGSGGATTSLL